MPDIVFADSETRSVLDLTIVGGYKYARHPTTDVLVWGWVFDDEQIGDLWSPEWAWGSKPGIRADKHPEQLLDHINEGGYFVAWNAAFDRHIWNEVMVKKYGWPVLKLEQVLCAQAQAEGNNLPGKLEKACEALGTHYRKDPKGKQLIATLCTGTRESWDTGRFETPEHMGHFRSYCLKDNYSMRDVWQATRPLTLTEWEEYHASEAINDRGVAVDVDFARAARNYASAEKADINEQLAELTGDQKLTVSAHLRKARYLYDELWPDEELQELVTKPPKKKGGAVRYSCDRPTRETVLDLLSSPDRAARFDPDHLNSIIQFLELIEAGNSAAVAKYSAIVNRAHGGRVHGSYSFNGAGQTGRFSSRGIQTHNMIRDPVEKGNPDRAIDAIEDIIDGRDTEYLETEYKFPISRLLARLIRPTFIAAPGKTLLWADWAQIEARKLPWLADSPGAEDKLDLFRQGLDVYKYAAQPIFNLASPDDADDHQRQVGKVAELALGFGGSVGAFMAMGRGYGLALTPSEIKPIVDAWRAANSWCVSFWDELWNAAIGAYNNPGSWYRAGRVQYLFHPDLMRGTLICQLPCGRWLVYPQFKRERIQYEDDEGVIRTKISTSFVKGFAGGYGRVELWYGILAENVTQASAASLLRMAVYDLQDWAVLHTHDEIVTEIDIGQEQEMTELVTESMTYLPEWATGLPLAVDIETGPFYTK